MLPAVSIFAFTSPLIMLFGVNHSSWEPSVAPFVFALQSLAAVITDSRCWGLSPGCFLL